MRGEEGGTAQTGAMTSAARPSWIGVGIGVAMFLMGMLGCVATGLAVVSASESDAVVVSYLGIPLTLAGVVAPIAALLVRDKDLPISIGVPVGCGCGTAVFSVVALVVFYTLVWPSL